VNVDKEKSEIKDNLEKEIRGQKKEIVEMRKSLEEQTLVK